MRKKISALLFSLIIIIGFVPNVKAEGYDNFTYGNKVEVMFVGDVETGEVFISKNEDKVLPAASMSKLMTYLVIKDELQAQNIKLEDEIEVNEQIAAFNIPGYSRMNLKVGDKVNVKELLEGLMVVSGNDAAEALALISGGTVENFVKKMTEKAQEIGLTNSTFVNPSGLTEEGAESEELKYNTMTARDLFNLTRQIMAKYPETEDYSKITSLTSKDGSVTEPSTLPNRDMPSMIGLKTGFTDEAGYCFTGLFDISKDTAGQDYKLINVVMGAETPEERETTSRELVEHVKSQYSYKVEFNPDVPLTEITDENTSIKYIPVYPEKSYSKLMPKTAEINVDYVLNKDLKAPYEDGEQIGVAVLTYKGEELEKINLINKGYIPKETFFSNLLNSIREFFDSILLLF